MKYLQVKIETIEEILTRLQLDLQETGGTQIDVIHKLQQTHDHLLPSYFQQFFGLNIEETTGLKETSTNYSLLLYPYATNMAAGWDADIISKNQLKPHPPAVGFQIKYNINGELFTHKEPDDGEQRNLLNKFLTTANTPRLKTWMQLLLDITTDMGELIDVACFGVDISKLQHLIECAKLLLQYDSDETIYYYFQILTQRDRLAYVQPAELADLYHGINT